MRTIVDVRTTVFLRTIGRKCILDMIELAKEKGMDKVKANIYSFNVQSQRMFKALGFTQTDDEWFECNIC